MVEVGGDAQFSVVHSEFTFLRRRNGYELGNRHAGASDDDLLARFDLRQQRRELRLGFMNVYRTHTTIVLS